MANEGGGGPCNAAGTPGAGSQGPERAWGAGHSFRSKSARPAGVLGLTGGAPAPALGNASSTVSPPRAPPVLGSSELSLRPFHNSVPHREHHVQGAPSALPIPTSDARFSVSLAMGPAPLLCSSRLLGFGFQFGFRFGFLELSAQTCGKQVKQSASCWPRAASSSKARAGGQ